MRTYIKTVPLLVIIISGKPILYLFLYIFLDLFYVRFCEL